MKNSDKKLGKNNYFQDFGTKKLLQKFSANLFLVRLKIHHKTQKYSQNVFSSPRIRSSNRGFAFFQSGRRKKNRERRIKSIGSRRPANFLTAEFQLPIPREQCTRRGTSSLLFKKLTVQTEGLKVIHKRLVNLILKG